MSRTITLAELRSDVRQRADVENDTHLSDAEINRYVSSSYSFLYGLLVRSGEAYFENTQTITTTGVATYALPADFYRMLRVRYRVDSQSWARVIEADPNIIDRVTTNGVRATWYRLVNNSIEFYPTPPSLQTYQLRYIPAAERLTGDNQSINGVNGWEELIVLDAAIKCLRKSDKQEMAAGLERDRLLMLKNIEDLAYERSIASSTRPFREEDVSYEPDPSSWRAS